jgi:hypothetical protein
MSESVYNDLSGADLSAALSRIEVQFTVEDIGGLEELAKQVGEAFGSERFSASEARPRCSAACPMCGMTCQLPQGHERLANATLHDCPHQPAGLIGVKYYQTRKLGEFCCKTMTQKDYRFISTSPNGDVRETPFREFNRIYPSWKTPDVSASAQDIRSHPRRYLFYTHFGEVNS